MDDTVKRVYVYQEGSEEESRGETLTKVFQGRKEASSHLKSRVEDYFSCKWDDIRNHLGADDEFHEDRVVYSKRPGELIFWELLECELL